MNDIPENKLRQVRALLAKAEGAATEEEALTYSGKAAELMAKYGIDAAMATDRTTNTAPIDKEMTLANPRAMLKANLLQGLAAAMRCKAIRVPPRRGQGDGTQKIYLFGFTSDVERVEVMYTSLLLQMTNGLARIRRTPNGESIRSYKNSWAKGFNNRVVARIKEAEDAAAHQATPQANGRSASLVLADRANLVNRKVSTRFPRVVSKPVRVSSSAGFHSGVEAGNRADIGQKRMAPTRRALGR